MPEQKASLKKDVGNRLLQFRKALNKTQQQLAEELNIYQSTITNYEQGKTFPNINYLHYFHKRHNLNLNWLLTGNGDKFLGNYVYSPESGLIDDTEQFARENPGNIKKYSELLCLMEIPVIEQVILAKILELKTLLKGEVEELYRTRGMVDNEAKQNDKGDEGR